VYAAIFKIANARSHFSFGRRGSQYLFFELLVFGEYDAAAAARGMGVPPVSE
jgi:hypothetical protein